MTRRQCLALLAGAGAVVLAPEFCRAGNEIKLLRVAVSVETLAGANINDARAAYKVWIAEVTREFEHPTAEAVPGVFISSQELIRGIRQGTIDCFGVTALEFTEVADLADPNALVLQDYLADGMEYVLLVHSSSRFNKLADLRGAQVLTHFHRDMVLLPAWLSIMLAANNLPAPERFFGNLDARGTLNQVVLPVFFRRADAACLARGNWETAVELNPQLGRDLRALAVSPKIIPIAIGFRRGCNPNGHKMLLESMLTISNSAAGRQISALYQARGFVARPTSVMNSTVEMVRQFERLSKQQAGSRNGKP
jgi:ABC-type phosphate/phosphonate transport system substrate-binding protein